MNRRDALRLLTLSLAVTTAAACGPVASEVVVDTAPPPDQVEVVGTAPYAGAVWVRGHWQWAGGRHVWRPGHWVRPRVGYVFVPGHWENWGHRWRFIPGHWQRG